MFLKNATMYNSLNLGVTFYGIVNLTSCINFAPVKAF